MTQIRFNFSSRCNPSRQLVGQRRRWESNPLTPGCSRWPCRLAPASKGFRQKLSCRAPRCISCCACSPPGNQEPTTGFAPASTALRKRCLSQSGHVGVLRCESISKSSDTRCKSQHQPGCPMGVEPIPSASQAEMLTAYTTDTTNGPGAVHEAPKISR